MLRTGVEEYFLSSEYSPYDELSAEFIRTFRQEMFIGKNYLDRYDAVHNKKDVTIDKCLPKSQFKQHCMDGVSLYGMRGQDPRLFYMSPWEFVQHWAPVQTRPPSRFYKYTMWTEDADQDRAEPGADYFIQPRKFQHRDFYVYPPRPDAGSSYNRFRNTWFLRRRLKPYVLCPESSPMQNSKMTSEQRSKIFSVYLRA